MSKPYTDEQHARDLQDILLAENYCYAERKADPTVSEETLLAGLIEKYGWDKERAADMLRQALHPVYW